MVNLEEYLWKARERIKQETGDDYVPDPDEVMAYAIKIYAEERGVSEEEAFRILTEEWAKRSENW